MKDLKEVFPEVNEKLATAELAAITPLFCSGGAKYIGKAEDALWVEDAGSAVRGEAAARRPGSEDATTRTTTCRRRRQMRACKS